MSGSIHIPHVCPSCKITNAKNASELLIKFGFRTLSSGVTNQSWCRNCRKEK